MMFGAVAAVAIQAGGRFSDKAGNMIVENWTSWKATRVGENGLKFFGTGQPIRGTWKDQGLKVNGQKIEGEAAISRNDRFQLTTATLSGNVNAEIRKTAEDGSPSNIDLDTETIVFDYPNSKVKLTSKVRIGGQWGKDRQTFSLDAPSAELVLPPPGQKSDFPLLHADVPGRVTMNFGGVRSARDPQTGKATGVKFAIVAKANHLVYDDPTRTIKLTGNVTISGEDPTIGGDIEASSATIKLTSDRRVKEIELAGSPGKSTVRDNRPPPQPINVNSRGNDS